MNPLETLIRARITAGGPMPVSEFMALALGHPKYGYYNKGDPFGADGDFTTAPEISQDFGELIGLWAAVTWQQMGSPEKTILIECGPGRGTLMKDALRAAAYLRLVLLRPASSSGRSGRQLLGAVPRSPPRRRRPPVVLVGICWLPRCL